MKFVPLSKQHVIKNNQQDLSDAENNVSDDSMSDLFPSEFLNDNNFYKLFYLTDELLDLVKDNHDQIDREEMSECQEKMEIEDESQNTKRKLDSKVNLFFFLDYLKFILSLA